MSMDGSDMETPLWGFRHLIVYFHQSIARLFSMTFNDRQIYINCGQNHIMQVTSQEMVSYVGKACSAPLQSPHIEALHFK